MWVAVPLRGGPVGRGKPASAVVPKPRLGDWDLVAVPASDSQPPSAQHCSPLQILGVRQACIQILALPFASGVILDQSPLLSRLLLPRLRNGGMREPRRHATSEARLPLRMAVTTMVFPPAPPHLPVQPRPWHHSAPWQPGPGLVQFLSLLTRPATVSPAVVTVRGERRRGGPAEPAQPRWRLPRRPA